MELKERKVYRIDISIEEYIGDINGYQMVFRNVRVEKNSLDNIKIIFKDLEESLEEILKN